jgi:UDP-N-acetylglucosamine diphosphorylase/glucosamine-1-phosphate N-acetyltransferase
MNLVLVDEVSVWQNLLPLTFTKPISKLRVGILTIDEKWKNYFPEASLSYICQDHLNTKFPYKTTNQAVFINSCVLPNEQLVSAIGALQENEVLKTGESFIAFKGTKQQFDAIQKATIKIYNDPIITIKHVYDLFKKNGEAITSDFERITKGKRSKPLSESVTVIGNKDLVFLEEGAKAEACILNTTSGPIYLGNDSEVMEGSVVRGPFALCEHSALKLSAKIYGPTTIGPHSKVGGEVNNSVIIGFSNKAHDGFLGNSVIGEWCNLGADTNNSNLKNNYANVKVYNYAQSKMVDTGLQFCGLIMGDYSKSGINTMFNTGTVVGVAANIYGGGFPATHIPSFSWGGAEGFETYKLDKLFETSDKVFERRGLVFDEQEKDILKAVFEQTKKDRVF